MHAWTCHTHTHTHTHTRTRTHARFFSRSILGPSRGPTVHIESATPDTSPHADYALLRQENEALKLENEAQRQMLRDRETKIAEQERIIEQLRGQLSSLAPSTAEATRV